MKPIVSPNAQALWGGRASESKRESCILRRGTPDKREGAPLTKASEKSQTRATAAQTGDQQAPEGKGEADEDTRRDHGAAHATAAPALAWAQSGATANSVAMMPIMATDRCIRSGRAVSTASVAVA